jgi:hypothetical protein
MLLSVGIDQVSQYRTQHKRTNVNITLLFYALVFVCVNIVRLCMRVRTHSTLKTGYRQYATVHPLRTGIWKYANNNIHVTRVLCNGYYCRCVSMFPWDVIFETLLTTSDNVSIRKHEIKHSGRGINFILSNMIRYYARDKE